MHKLFGLLGGVAVLSCVWGLAATTSFAADFKVVSRTSTTVHATSSHRGSCGECGSCGRCGNLWGRYRCRCDNYLINECFNCDCNGSYKFPVPPLYTYHWPGMYSQERMTDYHSPWRFPPLRPYEDDPTEEAKPKPKPRPAGVSAGVR